MIEGCGDSCWPNVARISAACFVEMKSLLLLLVGLSSLAFSAEAAAANNSVVQKTAGDGWEGLGSYFSGKHFVVDSNLKCTGRIGKNFKDCKYDAVIDCDDILALNGDGWPVGFRDEEVVTQLKKPGLIVAVLGLFNRGKTHILEKMTGKSLAPGLTQTTKGLSIIAPESQGSHVLYIDTAGRGQPAACAFLLAPRNGPVLMSPHNQVLFSGALAKRESCLCSTARHAYG